MISGLPEAAHPPLHRRKYLTIAILTALVVCINLVGVLSGITVVLSHTFYLPIILVSYWYPRRGLFFSGLLAAVYGVTAVLFGTPGDLATILVTLSRMAFFVLVGWIVAVLSLRLRESEQQLHDIIEFLPDATFAIDSRGTVVAWNRAMEAMTGLRKDEMLGKGEYAYALPFYGVRRPVLVDMVLHPENGGEADYPAVRREGDRIEAGIFIPLLRGGKGMHLRITASALLDAGGNVCGAIESIRDITDQVLTESALRNTSSRLNTIAGIIRLDLSKTLAVLYGHLSVGVMKFDDPAIISFIDDVRHSVKGVERQIEMSRVFRDIGTTPPVWLPVQAAVFDAVGRLGCTDVPFGVWTERLEVFADPNLPMAFYQVLYYYLKDGPRPAHPVVTYQPAGNVCTIRIEDRGSGLRVQDREALFSGWNEQSGFGLYLAREILALTGMTVRETGSPGEGVRFEILLPAGSFRVRGEGEPGTGTGTPPAGSTAAAGPATGPAVLPVAMPDDLPVVRELRVDEFPEADHVWYEYHETKGVPRADRIFAVFRGREIVSLARCKRHPDGMEVDGIYTPEIHRKKGYSHLAVSALVEACHNEDLYMHAVRHLTGFYGRYGFVPVDEKVLPPTIRERYTWAAGNLEGAEVQPMRREHGLPAG